MPNMTKGIRVIWPPVPHGRRRQVEIDEIEYFYGIDVNQLDRIPKFDQVPTSWPLFDPPVVDYVVDTQCKRNSPNEVRLVVTYNPENNQKIVKLLKKSNAYHHGFWGANTIVLQKGSERGRYEWQGNDGQKLTGEWEAFDLENGCARPGYTYRGSKREAAFRAMILGYDDYRCVLTCETTKQALDAAHLIPAVNGQNDVKENGITLRADLHRLFDADLFTFGEDGRVVEIAQDLSATYRRRLQNRCLPPPTLERVRATLALPQFQNRASAR